MKYQEEDVDKLLKQASARAEEIRNIFKISHTFFEDLNVHKTNLEFLVNTLLNDDTDPDSKHKNNNETQVQDKDRRFTFQTPTVDQSNRKTANFKNDFPIPELIGEEEDVVDLNDISQTEYQSNASRNKLCKDVKDFEHNSNFNAWYKNSIVSTDNQVPTNIDKNRFSFAPTFINHKNNGLTKTGNIVEVNDYTSAFAKDENRFGQNTFNQINKNGEEQALVLKELIERLKTQSNELKSFESLQENYNNLKKKYKELKEDSKNINKENTELKVQLSVAQHSTSEVVKMNDKIVSSFISNNDRSHDATAIEKYKKRIAEQKLAINKLKEEKEGLNLLLSSTSSRLINLEQDVMQMKHEYLNLYKNISENQFLPNSQRSTNTLDLNEAYDLNKINIKEHFSYDDVYSKEMEAYGSDCNIAVIDLKKQRERNFSENNKINAKHFCLKLEKHESNNLSKEEFNSPVWINKKKPKNFHMELTEDDKTSANKKEKVIVAKNKDNNDVEQDINANIDTKNEKINKISEDSGYIKNKKSLSNNNNSKYIFKNNFNKEEINNGPNQKENTPKIDSNKKFMKKGLAVFNSISEENNPDIKQENPHHRFSFFQKADDQLHDKTEMERLTHSEVPIFNLETNNSSRKGENKYSFVEFEKSAWNSLEDEQVSSYIYDLSDNNDLSVQPNMRGIIPKDMVQTHEKFSNSLSNVSKNSQRLLSEDKITYPENQNADKFYTFKNNNEQS